MEERIETMETELVENYDVVECEDSDAGKGSGFGKAFGIGLILAAGAGLGALVWKKTEKKREDRIIAKYEKIMAKRDAEAAEVEGFEEDVVIDVEDMEE